MFLVHELLFFPHTIQGEVLSNALCILHLYTSYDVSAEQHHLFSGRTEKLFNRHSHHLPWDIFNIATNINSGYVIMLRCDFMFVYLLEYTTHAQVIARNHIHIN